VLVFANKQDLPNALSVSELTAQLGLYNIKSKPWYVQSCIASRGEGIYEGLEWLSTQLKKTKQQSY
jgi:signal recognition particle receptor subunit beta